MSEHETLTLIATLKILFPMRLLIPFCVIMFSISIVATNTEKDSHKSHNVTTQDSTFIQKLIEPVIHPPKFFKK